MMPVILDGDPGHDDAIAWTVAFAAPRLEVRGVVAVAGNASVARTTENMRRIVTLLGVQGVPLAQGAARPLVAEPIVAPSVHGESGLDGPVLPEPAVDLEPGGGVELMARLLRESAEPVWLVPTGPLTNVATLMLAHPELTPRIAGISLMGGGVLAGNWTPAAEFNVLADPEAAHTVFTSGVPILMAGLDVTQKALFLPRDVERLRSLGGPLAGIVADWLTFFFAFHRERGYEGAPLHDPVAVAALTHPEILDVRPMYVQVETTGEYTRGATVGDVHGVSGRAPNVQVAMGIDRQAYVDLVVDAVARLGRRR